MAIISRTWAGAFRFRGVHQIESYPGLWPDYPDPGSGPRREERQRREEYQRCTRLQTLVNKGSANFGIHASSVAYH